MELPNEEELVSVFETLPDRKDETDEFQFDTSTFKLENGTESFEIVLSPFYNEFTLTVTEMKRQETISYLKLRSVEKIEILKDRKKAAAIRIFHGRSESYIHTLELAFKPRFQMALQELYL